MRLSPNDPTHQSLPNGTLRSYNMSQKLRWAITISKRINEILKWKLKLENFYKILLRKHVILPQVFFSNPMFRN